MSKALKFYFRYKENKMSAEEMSLVWGEDMCAEMVRQAFLGYINGKLQEEALYGFGISFDEITENKKDSPFVVYCMEAGKKP